MLRLFKKKVAAETSISAIRKEIQDYLIAYMKNMGIDATAVRVKNIEVLRHNDELCVDIVAGFPSKLIGTKGVIIRDLSRRMSKHMDITMKLNVRM